MLLPQLQDELERAASAAHPLRRARGRAASALGAALVVLLLAAPAAHGELAPIVAAPVATHVVGGS